MDKTYSKRNTRHARRPRHSRRSRYIPALDGLRALAVLGVIFYHMNVGWAPGGLMGVTVFFVISGYLINGLLVGEYERTGRISLSQFWLRRARRILPAVLLAIAGTIVLCAIVSPALLDKARQDVVPSLLFFNNWWQIVHDVSYFEAASAPSPLTHYWSLAIEEQFYIVWPLLLIVLLKLKVNKKVVGAIALVLAVASGVEMAVLYDPLGDPSRVYYGTDTRAVSLLVGVWLAIAWPSSVFGRRRTFDLSKGAWIGLNIAGVVALLGIIAIMVFTNGYSAFPYYGGIVLVSVLSAVLITALVVPHTWVARLFQISPLVWVGKRSYGMYLWHFPIILLTSHLGLPIDVPWWVRASQLVVIFAISELSFRFVEDPIRKGALGDWWRTRGSKRRSGAGVRAGRIATTAVVAGVFAAAAVGIAVVPAPDKSVQASASVIQGVAGGRSGPVARATTSSAYASDGASGALAENSSGVSANSLAAARTASKDSALYSLFETIERAKEEAFYGPHAGEGRATWFAGLVDSTRAAVEAHPRSGQTMLHGAIGTARTLILDNSPIKRVITTAREMAADRRDAIITEAYEDALGTEHLNKTGKPMYNPVLIGDSVSAGCIDEFCRVFPFGLIDAVPNRNIWESPYADYANADQVGEYVVFCLGTNNAVEDFQVDEMLGGVAPDKRVILVNIRAPRDWEGPTNQALGKAPERFPNVVKVIDWYNESAGHSEYFYDDGIHLTNNGPQAYIGLIHDAIEEDISARALEQAMKQA